MGLDYKHTCPDIDKSLKCIADILDNAYSDISIYIEDVRESNISIREEADKQIDDLNDKIEELNDELNFIRNERDDIEKTLYKKEEEIENLLLEIKELKKK